MTDGVKGRSTVELDRGKVLAMSTHEILVSPGHGAGWASWNTEHGHGKALAEDPELIRLVKAGAHTGLVSGADLRAAGIVEGPKWPDSGTKFEASLAFIRRAWEVNGRRLPYFGGVGQLRVERVSGPYRIEDYDGHESVVMPGCGEWW